MNKMAITNFGSFKGLAINSFKTCLFLPNGKDTWSFLSHNYSDKDREDIIQQLLNWQMTGMICLLSNTDPRVPVSFFNEWGGEADWNKILKLEAVARLFYNANAGFVPCIFCDDGDNYKYHNASPSHQERSIGLLLTVLRPFIPAVLIGLESSEYFNKQQHEFFIQLIKRFAPDIFVGTHMQKEPAGGMPAGLDFVAYEHSWSPVEGDRHSVEEVVAECRQAEQRWHLPIFPVEYNTNINGTKAKEQARALLKAGFGCGTPYL
jgi:hypothetical protein